MNIEVNNMAVLLATGSSMLVGAIWYSPYVLGKQWMKLTGVTPEKMREGGNKGMLAALARSLVMAYVLAHIVFLTHSFYQNSLIGDALTTGLWIFFGFTGFTIFMHDIFEGRKTKLSLINGAHEFVTIMVMAAVIGIFG